MIHTIDVLRSLSLPATVLTDRFGPLRDWAKSGDKDMETGRMGWNSDSGYRPVHYGTDYRATDPVVAPGDGVVCSDGKEMLTFVPSLSGAPVHDCAFYLMHVASTLKSQAWAWERVKKGEPIATHARSGSYPPHLHLELAVTIPLHASLKSLVILGGEMYSPYDFKKKASARGMSVVRCEARVMRQIETDGILLIETDAIYRRNLPSYKRVPYSYLGHDMVAVVDATKVMGDE